MATFKLTTAQAIVKFLSAQYTERDGIEHKMFRGVFGIFGHGNVTGLGQALEEMGQDLPYYRPQNEQAMVHTSAAYAKMKNRLEMFACTSSVGPGATNMVTGAATATVNRLPVLLLPGDTFASRLPHPVLQQLEHPLMRETTVNDAFRPVSRFWDRITRPEQVLDSLPEAMRILTDQSETGAVTICLPEDVQTEAYDYPESFFEKHVHRIVRTVPPESQIVEAAQMIQDSKRPLIVSGGGAIYSEASEVLDKFTSTFGIPLSETQAGKGVLPWNHDWNLGPIGSNGGLAANRLARDADLVICVGTRLQDFTTASKTAFQNPEVRFIGINIASMDAHKLGALPLVGDARNTLEALYGALIGRGFSTSEEYRHDVANLKRLWDAAVDEERSRTIAGKLTEANVIKIVNEFSRPQDVVVCAAGGLPGDLLKLWRACDPKGYHLEYGYSCMGYEIAGGLGVKMADPSREVYVMVGDGSYLMLHTEIVTSLQEGYKLTIVVVDNSGFQCIRGLQMSSGSPSFGNELRYRDRSTNRLEGPYMQIDFAKNAESLGAVGMFADNAADLRSALERASKADRTVVIHVPVDPDAKVSSFESWWDVPVAEVSSEESVIRARKEYESAREKQRFYY